MVQDRELQLPTHRILGRREHSEPYDVERWQVAPSELGGVGGPPRGGYEGTRGEEGQPSVLISMASDGDADSGGDDTVEEGIPPSGRLSRTDVTSWLQGLGFGLGVQYRAAVHDDYCEMEWFENYPSDQEVECCARELQLGPEGVEKLRDGIRQLNGGTNTQSEQAPEPEPEPEVGWWQYQNTEGIWQPYPVGLSVRLDERLREEEGRMPPDILNPDVDSECGSQWFIDLNQMRQVRHGGTLPGPTPAAVRLCPVRCEADPRAVPRDTAASLARASPTWLDDKQQKNCMLCSKKFGEGSIQQWWQKYPCRYCGWVVCAECTPFNTLGFNQKTLPVDRWISSQSHSLRFARPPGTKKEKRICKSCLEFAPAEVKARTEIIEREALTNYEREHNKAPGTASLSEVLRSSKGVGGWAAKSDHQTCTSQQRLSDLISEKVAAISTQYEPFFTTAPLVVDPADEANHTHTLIVLHGFTGTAESMLEPIVTPLRAKFKGLRCVLPTAPRRIVSCYKDTESAGEEHTCWYDYFTDRSGQDQEEDINEEHVVDARAALLQLMQDELERLSRVPSTGEGSGDDLGPFANLAPANERLFVLGYSQGGCMALDCAMTVPFSLGGVIGLRCHLMSATSPVSPSFTSQQHVLAYHGEADDTIACVLAQRLAQRMVATPEEEGHILQFVTQAGLGHGDLGGAQELLCVVQFLQLRMAAATTPAALVRGSRGSSSGGDGEADECEVLSVLCYGDSLTAGYHSYGTGFEPYARTLGCDLDSTNTQPRYQLMVCNPVGACGATAKALADNAEKSDNDDICGRKYDGIALALQKGPAWADSRSYDYCVIMAGTNDLDHLLVSAATEPNNAGAGAVSTVVEHVMLLHQRCHAVGVRTIALPIPPNRSIAVNMAYAEQWRQVNLFLRDRASTNPMITFIDMVSELPFFAAAAAADKSAVTCNTGGGGGESNTDQQQQWWEDDGLHLRPLGSAEFGRVLRVKMVTIGLIAPIEAASSSPPVRQLPEAKPALRLRGLPVYGNYCFLNAALQCLRHTPTVHSLLTAYAQASSESNREGCDSLLQVTGELFAHMGSRCQQQIDEEEAIDVAYQRFVASCSTQPTWSTWSGPLVVPCARPSIQEQQDAGELFDKLLEALAGATDPTTGALALARLSSVNAPPTHAVDDGGASAGVAVAVPEPEPEPEPELAVEGGDGGETEDARDRRLTRLFAEIGRAHARADHALIYSLLTDFAHAEWDARDIRVHTTAHTHLGALFQGQQLVMRRCCNSDCSYLNFRADPSLIAENEVRLAATFVDTDTGTQTGFVKLNEKLHRQFHSHRLARDHRCPSCSAQGTTTERVSFFRLPEVLIVRVGRIDRREDQKINSSLDFPDLLDLRECLLFPQRPLGYDGTACSTEYQLFAACFHTGLNACSGHYTAVVRMDTSPSPRSHHRQQEEVQAARWALIDDSRVQPDCDSPQDMERANSDMPTRAFMLFYSRCRLQPALSREHQSPMPTTDIFDTIMSEPIGAHRVDGVAIKNETPWPLQMYWLKQPESVGTGATVAAAAASVGSSNDDQPFSSSDDNAFWKKQSGVIAVGDVHHFIRSFSGHIFVFKTADTGRVLDCYVELHDATLQWYSVVTATEEDGDGGGGGVGAGIAVVQPLFDRPAWAPPAALHQPEPPSSSPPPQREQPILGADVDVGDDVRVWSISRRRWVLATVLTRSKTSPNFVNVEYVYEPGCGKWVDSTDDRVLITQSRYEQMEKDKLQQQHSSQQDLRRNHGYSNLQAAAGLTEANEEAAMEAAIQASLEMAPMATATTTFAGVIGDTALDAGLARTGAQHAHRQPANEAENDADLAAAIAASLVEGAAVSSGDGCDDGKPRQLC